MERTERPLYTPRPSTAGLIDLHVYCVPDDVWNAKLNTAPIHAINKFISAGFIRAPPDMLLRTLRERLGEFLGEDLVLDKFSFLKCVGRSLALVKAKQEMELKLKSFAPPYAGQPELYLLPGVEGEGSSYGSSVTPGQRGHDVSYSESASTAPLEDGHLWDQAALHPITEIHQNQSRTDPEEKASNNFSSRMEQETAPHPNVKYPRQQVESKTAVKLSFPDKAEGSPAHPGTNSDSGISSTFRDAETEHRHRKRDDIFFLENKSEPETRRENAQIGTTSFRPLPEPAQYCSPPSPPPLPAFPPLRSPPPRAPESEGSLVQHLEKVKEERLKLEKSREELIRKTKSLLEQYKVQRQKVRDSWKKKYFETKKITAVLEETLSKCRADLEICYQKLLSQLAARDSRKRLKYPMLAGNSKNSVIMSITSHQQEVERLKRRVEDARIKLLIEMKMRKQASSDLNVLKAQLAKRKSDYVVAHHVLPV